MESDVKILVRERELACRNAWGDDLWSSTSSPATTPQQLVRPALLAGHRLDDQVTSVIDASTHGRARTMPDDVVTFTTVRAGDALPRTPNDVNEAAVADQAERARVMARGSRDAILSARKRHALRRSTPLENLDEVDQASEPESISAEEVHGAGSGIVASIQVDSEPAASASTFAPEVVRSSVGLTRLRSFLRGEGDDQVSSEVASLPGRPSHFDHVMMQAERIKERAAAQRPHGLDTDAPEAFVPRIEPVEKPVVWDVDPEVLDVGFARLRPVPEQADMAPSDSVEVASGQDTVLSDGSLRTAIYRPNPLAATASMTTTLPEQGTVEHLATGDLEEDAGSEPVSPTDTPDEHEDIAFDSPRSSLWRSFNQRLRRRFKVHTESHPVTDFDDRFIEDDPHFQGYEDQEAEDSSMAASFHASDPETWYDPDQDTPTREASVVMLDTSYDGFIDESLDVDRENARKATSEESWRLDEREFPEPQPAEWHRTRRELLLSLPPVESLDDSVQFVAPTPHSTPVAPLTPRRPLPDPRDFFDITEPSGLAAFRAALFGSSSQTIGHHLAASSPVSETTDAAPPTAEEPYAATFHVRQHSPQMGNDGTWSPPLAEEMPRFEPFPSRSKPFPLPEQSRGPATDRRDSRQGERSQHRGTVAKPISAPVVGGKSCATCRSFLPDGDGTRGRCTNEWASQHRSVVEADELACRSSFGDWWIAADSTWIPVEEDPVEEEIRGRVRSAHVRTRNVL
jgi:hypothetical protein